MVIFKNLKYTNMKYLIERYKFTLDKNVIKNESFDMSMSGPLGNDINWGDSLLGRLIHAANRKAIIEVNTKRVDKIADKIKLEFDYMLDINKIKDDGTFNKVNVLVISTLLENLKRAIDEGIKVNTLISMVGDIINKVEKIDIKKNNLVSEDSKDDLLKQLNDFLEFLNTLDANEGVSVDDEDKSNKFEYSNMVNTLTNLKNILSYSSQVSTNSESSEDNERLNIDIDYIYKTIIKYIQSNNSEFNNNLLNDDNNKTGIKWTIFEISNNSIVYRKSNKLLTLNDNKTITVNMPKINRGNSDGKPINLKLNDKPINQTIKFSKENIKIMSKYFFDKLENLKNLIDKNNNIKLNENEISWFNNNFNNKWVVFPLNNSYTKGKIEKCDDNGNVILLISKQGANTHMLSLNTFLHKTKIFNSEKEANDSYNSLYNNGENVLSNKGETHNIANKQVTTESLLNHLNIYDIINEKDVLDDKESHAEQALNKIKKQINVLIDNGVTGDFLSDVISHANDLDVDKKLKYSKIIKELFVDIKNEYNSPDLNYSVKLYENILDIGNVSKRKNIANKIARFAKVSLLLKGENLYGELGKLGENLEKFNNSFEKLLLNEVKESNSIIRNFEKFKLIKESDDGDVVDTDNKDIDESELSDGDDTKSKIKNFFIKNVHYKRWVVEKTTIERIKKEVDDQTSTSNDDNKIDIDHILEIVKLFKRAYKIYTTPVIPSARSGGKVSNSKFLEYTYLGSGSQPTADRAGESGPWRNNKIFDSFESKIDDIIKDRKYQVLFHKKTKILIGSGELKNGGSILLKLIHELMDGDRLYKTGALSSFMKKYFELDIKDSDTGEDNKLFSTTKIADSTPKQYYFKSVNSIKYNTKTIHVVNSSNSLYFIVFIGTDDDYIYFKYSKSMYIFKNYMKGLVNKGDINSITMTSEPIYYCRINKNDFEIKSNSSDEYNFTQIDIYDFKKSQENSKSNNNSFKNISYVYSLVSESGNIGLCDKTYFDSDKDSDKYNLLKNKLKK